MMDGGLLRRVLDLVGAWTTISDENEFRRALGELGTLVSYETCAVYVVGAGHRETYRAGPAGAFERCEPRALDEALRRPLIACQGNASASIGFGLPSVMAAPLPPPRSARIVGSIAMSSQTRYREDDLRLLKLIATFIAGTFTRLLAMRAMREESSRKDALLAVLGHDLRSPLSTISSVLGALRLAGRSEAELDLIARQVASLARMADDLSDLTRIARGKVALDLASAELATAIDHGLEAVRAELENHGQRLVTEVPRRGLVVLADVERLAQVIAKLVRSTSSHSPYGAQIAVRARRREDRAVLSIRGEAQPIDAFAVGSGTYSALRDTPDGVDVDLLLARCVIELHGGTLTMRKDDGRELELSLPRTRIESAEHVVPDAAAIVAALRARVRPCRVLVVDDDADVARTAGALLEQLGYTVELVYDGEHALARFDAFAPDAVLLDLALPGIDGYEVARALRAREDGGRRIRLVAMTGFGSEQHRARARSCGFDAHLLKPFDVFALTSALQAEPSVLDRVESALDHA